MDVDTFPCLIHALMRPDAYPHPADPVEHIETHISHVFLAGAFAYKLKKPIDLGFLDFSTLERRRRCCEEELRLNRRLAPALYLGVVAVTGTANAPRIGGTGPVQEYAVQMHRFPQEALLDRQELSGELIDRLAVEIAEFHARIPVADPESPFGTPDAVLAPMVENLVQIRSRALLPDPRERLDRVEAWTRARWQSLIPMIERRRRNGFVRECHGDMHRGNVALVNGEIRIFDAIEFNPFLRWIDTASEIAFLTMDLDESGAEPLGRRFLNRYLERSGDYELLSLLDLYKVYRALVRAKVMAIRLAQADLDPAQEARDRSTCIRYLELAESYTCIRSPRLLIACGLSGSGKSYMARLLREALPLIHLRSDIERKRLFGISETVSARASLDAGIYFPTATEWTYDRLLRLAEAILGYGYDVLVDATFIRAARRALFWDLARRQRIPIAILALDAPLDVLRHRIVSRRAEKQDVSDADVRVLERQRLALEPLASDERVHAVFIDTSRTPPLDELLERIEAAFVSVRAPTEQ
ncbi:bifunctional aminoglycoside phosphotransferase/ATP-binding protein [Thiocapsa bogorovii]|uniref:bifunctional aminoglycoside phosphotransferase/ATP-binding protein n=1 Tax=Thiocapsa bogorovii TaxID=521689 RepID=UPI001E2F8207|nr:bifunctional aminoglycoside phosphotransferase/ATP-binding protein [Thiocapsa bogorovii]UHD18871.1 AAA family ATPase [Thiocapsa bogorovii]